MNTRYKLAWKEDDVVVYLDDLDCKYVAKKGNVAWRINNPGMLKRLSPYACRNEAIGSWDSFAIFGSSVHGHKALEDWLQSDKMQEGDLHNIGEHYTWLSSTFSKELSTLLEISSDIKLKKLKKTQFKALLASIEKLCGYVRVENEEFSLLPRISAKIEYVEQEIKYLIGIDITLSLDEAIEWINTYRLDAVIVHNADGSSHIRSRPGYRMEMIELDRDQLCESVEESDLLARVVGTKTEGQCVWGFINGVLNSRDDAVESSYLISRAAGGEQVISLQNDSAYGGMKDFSVCLIFKTGVSTPIVGNAVKFLLHLLALSARDKHHPPVIIFAHSQGAAIAEHALSFLSERDRKKIRVFTFGGWDFIPPHFAHHASHNYISVADLIPRLGSMNHQYFVMRRYEGVKAGLSLDEIIRDLAFEDAINTLDTLDPSGLNKYARERRKYYELEFKKISNVTTVEAESSLEHSFSNGNYQEKVRWVIDRYKTKESWNE